MIDMLRRSLSGREPGQSLIFVAILASTLLLTTGVAVEGGHGLVEQRKLQAAADMAALIGAQDLPCARTDATCRGRAETDACIYAQNNGYSGCIAEGTGGSWASVPPQACSPYDFIDYGNDWNHSPPCNPGTAPSNYFYIEVHLQETLHLAVVNVNLTLSAHAVARRAIRSPGDYALVVLDPHLPKALNMSGSPSSAFSVVGSILVDSDAPNAIYTGGQGQPEACDGQWYTASSEPGPPSGSASLVLTVSGGSPVWAPVACTGAPDSPPGFFQTASAPDPYASSSLPLSCNTTCTGSIPGCPSCATVAWYYQWTTSNNCPAAPDYHMCGIWNPATTSKQLLLNTSSTNYELFPGVYPGGIKIDSGATVYLNPGVYSIGGDFTIQGNATVCIYGAPVCDMPNDANPAMCSTASFNPVDTTTYVSPDTYYYHCSHWGYWDPVSLPGRAQLGPGSPCAICAPSFISATGALGAPLNGVVFYMYSGNLKFTGTSLADFAAPNPCLGTGNYSGSSVQFPLGSLNAVYTYPVGSFEAQDSQTGVGAASSPPGQLYPNMELTLAGECGTTNYGNDWPGEFGPGATQHLHFLVFERNPNGLMQLTGDGAQNWWGILYNPGAPSCGNNGSACSVTVNGNANGGPNAIFKGPPTFAGQIIADNVTFSGNALVTLYYRPCVPGNSACGLGPGTSLVE
jgi:Putative Flp pilus-assembly TadE/G-like